MKKLLVFTFFIALPLLCLAQDIPGTIKSAFDTKFPGAEVINHINAGDRHIIMFKNGNQVHKASFGADGSWKETMSVLPFTEAPQAIKDYLASNHAGVDFDDFWQVESPDGKLLKVTSDNLAVFFDTAGTFRRTEEIADPAAGM